MPRIVYVDKNGFVQLAKTESQKELVKRRTPPPTGESITASSQKDTDGIQNEKFENKEMQHQSLVIEQRPSVEYNKNDRAENETQRAAKNPALG